MELLWSFLDGRNAADDAGRAPRTTPAWVSETHPPLDAILEEHVSGCLTARAALAARLTCRAWSAALGSDRVLAARRWSATPSAYARRWRRSHPRPHPLLVGLKLWGV
mmetsp:Transcript_28122/g.87020  ORF Transcript_28122/g.87020 Transcript_28122/m.87020 type:complete len:108 (+) Transcript_28122:503-826(+)